MEINFIRGNRDGPRRRNETYTVCRLGVTKQRYRAEKNLGLHQGTVALCGAGACPAESCRERTEASLSRLKPAELSVWEKKLGNLTKRPPQAAEHLHSRNLVDGSYTICRLQVPRLRMVEEVREGLHPGYHVGKTEAGFEYVQGNPTTGFDNVNKRH